MTFKGLDAGYISLALGGLFFALLVITLVFPGTITLSTGAVVVGLGTVIATIALGIFLVADK